MKYWKAHYRDEFHDEDILIANEEADKIHKAILRKFSEKLRV